jgi:hypothetical protein
VHSERRRNTLARMTPDIEAFLKQLRSHPEILSAARSNPKLYGDLLRLQGGLAELQRGAYSDKRLRDLFSDVRDEVARDERSIKQRLLRISEIMAQAKERNKKPRR